jgi:arylsulfatase A-like enzyme
MRASTSDLLPTLCSLLKISLPDRPLDGIDISPTWTKAAAERPAPLCFWKLNDRELADRIEAPWIEPVWQEGTTPLVKLSGGKPTRTFKNNRYAFLPEDFTSGSRTIIAGDMKLVLHDRRDGDAVAELFNLATDPGETENLLPANPAAASTLQQQLTAWQRDVMKSLSGADYHK